MVKIYINSYRRTRTIIRSSNHSKNHGRMENLKEHTTKTYGVICGKQEGNVLRLMEADSKGH